MDAAPQQPGPPAAAPPLASPLRPAPDSAPQAAPASRPQSSAAPVIATIGPNTGTSAAAAAAGNPSAPAAGASDNSAAAEKRASAQRPADGLLANLKGLLPGRVRQVLEPVLAVWGYKVFMDVTVEKMVIGLILLLIGYLAAKRISRWFATRILGRLGIQRNNAATVQTVSFYALITAFTLFTLNTLGVPVTVFSFFGGALAVGIGFGSQNIVNNFISGLILLAERPIRVGDVIQIDGVTGKVTEIGARSTRVTTGSNMEILVPNSSFLQTNVVNWTLSDDVVSSKVTVGVAYGSQARRVAELLERAAREHPQVLKTPPPQVSFTNFGDHALEFELSFWLRLSESDRGRLESDLRFAIDDLFAEHGIIIAYPQRDVHLNVLRPVEVRLAHPPAGELRRAAA